MLAIPALLGIPANLHQRWNGYRNVGRSNFARNEGGNRKGLRTQDAHATFADILNSSVNFPRGCIAGSNGRQTAGSYVQGLWKPRVLSTFSFLRPFHDDGSSPIMRTAVKSTIGLIHTDYIEQDSQLGLTRCPRARKPAYNPRSRRYPHFDHHDAHERFHRVGADL